MRLLGAMSLMLKLLKHWNSEGWIFLFSSFSTCNFGESFELFMFVSFVPCHLFTYLEQTFGVFRVVWHCFPFFISLPLEYFLLHEIYFCLGFCILFFFLLELFHILKEKLWLLLSVFFSSCYLIYFCIDLFISFQVNLQVLFNSFKISAQLCESGVIVILHERNFRE